MNAVAVLLKKDFALFFRDKTSVLLTFLVPFVLIYIFGNIFGGSGDGDGGPNASITLAVLDASNSPSGEVLVQALRDEPSLNIITERSLGEGQTEPFTEQSLRAAIEDRQFNFALVFPPDLLKDEGIGLRMKFISNPRNEVETQMVNGLLQKAVFTRLPQLLAPRADEWQQQMMGNADFEDFQQGLADLLNESVDTPGFEASPADMKISGLIDWLAGASGVSGEAGEGGSVSVLNQMLEIEEDQVYGKEVKNPFLTRMIGGYAIMFLLFATTASATSLFGERNEGLFLRLLSMPVKRTHILWSKYLFNLLLGVLQVLTLFVAASFLFDIDVWSNLPNLLVVCVLAASACTAFGMLLSALCRTQQQASGLGTLLILGMTSMSGAWIPMQFMPELMQIIGKTSLVYWSIESFSGVLWEGANLVELAPRLGVLALYSAVLMVIAAWRFRTGQLFNQA